MSDFSYDLVVIGSGPAGEGAAINAVKQGYDGCRLCRAGR